MQENVLEKANRVYLGKKHTISVQIDVVNSKIQNLLNIRNEYEDDLRRLEQEYEQTIMQLCTNEQKANSEA